MTPAEKAVIDSLLALPDREDFGREVGVAVQTLLEERCPEELVVKCRAMDSALEAARREFNAQRKALVEQYGAVPVETAIHKVAVTKRLSRETR